MEHKDLAAEFEKEIQLQKQKENFLKARQILSDKQNTVVTLYERYSDESQELVVINEAFGTFTVSGDIDAFMKDIKETSYFGKR